MYLHILGTLRLDEACFSKKATMFFARVHFAKMA